MTKRFTLTVPDDLAEKIQKWKEDFNLSKVFQEAIAGAIQEKEDFQNRLEGDDSMEQIVERLRNEKNMLVNDCYSEGKDEGLDWAKAASYHSLLRVVDGDLNSIINGLIKYGCNDSMHPLTDDEDPEVSDYFKEIFEENAEEYEYQARGQLFDDWLKGWLAGVEEFWQVVKNKI